jgi:ABC-type nitrate/sulfonate/bicarbonate transport system permease component
MKETEAFILNESVTSSAVLNTTSKSLSRNEVFSTALATTYREAGGFKTAATLSFGMIAIFALLHWSDYLNKLR